MAPAFLFPAGGMEWKRRTAMAIPLPDLGRELEARLEAMGLELVLAQWAGTARRPILRIRMDLPDSVPGRGGVSVEQCARVSRTLEEWLDHHAGVPAGYVLEVSSPGVERPLVRPRDWERFRGQRVRVKGEGLPGGHPARVEGEILGLEEDVGGGEASAALLLEGGERVRIPLSRIRSAHLLFRWDR